MLERINEWVTVKRVLAGIGVFYAAVLVIGVTIGSCSASPAAQPLPPRPTAIPTPMPAPTSAPNPPKSLKATVVDTQHILAIEPFLDEISKSVAPTGLQYGFVYNEWGDQCEYVQHSTHRTAPSYFYDESNGSETIMIFSDQKCMTLDLLGMGYLQKQVNDLIAKWHYAPEVKFNTYPQDLYNRGGFQDRGWCMQSSTHPLFGIAVEYFLDGESMVVVMHETGLSCADN